MRGSDRGVIGGRGWRRREGTGRRPGGRGRARRGSTSPTSAPCSPGSALGFAAARFGVFLREDSSTRTRLDAATLIGLSLVGTGAASTALSLVRFLRARDQIADGRFRAEYWPEMLLAALTAALGIGVVTYLLVRG